MISTGARSITSAISGLPPITANATSTALPLNKPEQPQLQHSLTGTKTTRRNAALISLIAPLVPSLCQPAPATAFSIGISGPKDWLREQKKKASKFILAPIDASRESLRTAYRLLTKNASGYPKDLEEIQNLLRSAARDCVPQERNSFVSFQANTGIEVCTFRLIVKNASSLLDNASPVKLKAEAMLGDLIRSFTSLNEAANNMDIQLASDRQKVADELMGTMYSLDKFEQSVRDCLEI
ncbi:PREDICTED: uncharacterized protein LOC104601866 isoform X1 [Nelumbo nucifera]|uniref:Uncharacterized protein LOC104601866 isoform X1 n=1 Tax=Nelumbo nucifera TaxID=4432 RepID=A0A1U8AA98_NELNU|nr:PREDICTED: uncharacterized protein LOC104601866 isoform X1 [Nelumbo nucifera]